MNELKRCPFCGGKAEEVITGKNTGDWKYRVRCTVCGIGTGATVCNPTHIDKWNRRVAEDYTDEILKVLDRCEEAEWE